ncbi:MAG: Rpn family recombination-promoting nuclease/putative transposase [Caldilineaceae bacterium]|nr:Rpn family recombination-promoting nuclease/putative transposase [Caldilineaceae bacterium]
MSAPKSTGTPFSYDRTLKSLFAERDVVRDLLDFHAADLFPDLQGFEPLELVSASTVTADATNPPHHEEAHRDIVWTLARKGDDGDRVLLHLEFQSQRDSRMTRRMFGYAEGLLQRQPELEVFGLVISTGSRHFGTWRQPVQSRPGSHGYGLQEGPLLDIHDYAVPVFPMDDYPLPPQSLVTGIVALARIQAAIRRGANEAAEQILPLLREWIIPRVLRLPATLREAYGAWFKAAFDELLQDQPELRRELRRIIYIEEAEAVMNTFGNIIAAKEKEGEARGLERGLERGEARGKKEILLQFVAEFWSDDEAARFAQQLDSADRSQFPTIADLMRDQAAGRLPRLQENGHTDPRK